MTTGRASTDKSLFEQAMLDVSDAIRIFKDSSLAMQLSDLEYVKISIHYNKRTMLVGRRVGLPVSLERLEKILENKEEAGKLIETELRGFYQQIQKKKLALACVKQALEQKQSETSISNEQLYDAVMQCEPSRIVSELTKLYDQLIPLQWFRVLLMCERDGAFKEKINTDLLFEVMSKDLEIVREVYFCPPYTEYAHPILHLEFYKKHKDNKEFCKFIQNEGIHRDLTLPNLISKLPDITQQNLWLKLFLADENLSNIYRTQNDRLECEKKLRSVAGIAGSASFYQPAPEKKAESIESKVERKTEP